MSLISQAFVLGAGLGTRLRRLTQCRPKPLIPLLDQPLICHAFDHLINAGVRHLIVNTHHLAGRYEEVFPDQRYRETPITFLHEVELLETGGGIKHIELVLDRVPFIVYNGDILSTLPLAPAMANHLRSGAEVTLVLRRSGGPLHVALNVDGQENGCPIGSVADIRRLLDRAEGAFLFTGIYLVSPSFLQRLKLEKASVIPTFLQMIREGRPPRAIVIDEGEWHDLGTREEYLDAQQRLLVQRGLTSWIDPSAQIASGATVGEGCCIGAGAIVGDGVKLQNTTLWPGATVEAGSQLDRCILTDNVTVSGSHCDQDF